MILFYSIAGSAQTNDLQIEPSLAKKITISGFCLCKTTVDDLKKLSTDFKIVDVEEMNFGKRCFGGHDSRYESGKGYYSEKYPGIIFQKDEENNISKIRLIKDYNGTLPDGTSITMNTLLVKDVLKIYPKLKNKWRSRGCSDYYTFSNDTLSFFVKIDTNKKPQYPVDEKYYMDKPIEGVDLMISCYGLTHKEDDIVLFSPNEPMIFVDSIRMNEKAVENTYQPTEFAFITIYKDSNAIRIAGKEAKNGLVYITTKSFARAQYWNYFKSKSKDYEKLVTSLQEESKVVYILNNKILKKDFEKELFEINDKNFIDLVIINDDKLKSDYKISGKSIGVVIRTK